MFPGRSILDAFPLSVAPLNHKLESIFANYHQSFKFYTKHVRIARTSAQERHRSDEQIRRYISRCLLGQRWSPHRAHGTQEYQAHTSNERSYRDRYAGGG